jgi:hypothetical protein
MKLLGISASLLAALKNTAALAPPRNSRETVACEPSGVAIFTCASGQSATVHNAEQEIRKHQTPLRFGVDADPLAEGAIRILDYSAPAR